VSQVPIAISLQSITILGSERRAAPILGPLSLEIAAGQHILIVGPSGCGKSTLLRAIAGLVEPSTGSLELFGQPASGPGTSLLPPERRGIGMLFQDAALWPHMSAQKTLRFVLKNAGLDASKQRIAQLLGEVHLSGFEKRMPATLSGGERQRLALARAMAVEPKLLLLDEPLGPLDQELRQDLLESVARLHHSHSWTTLHVTHDPEEAANFADRTIRLCAGQLVADPTPAAPPSSNT